MTIPQDQIQTQDTEGCYPFDGMKKAHDSMRSETLKNPHMGSTEKLLRPNQGDADEQK